MPRVHIEIEKLIYKEGMLQMEKRYLGLTIACVLSTGLSGSAFAQGNAENDVAEYGTEMVVVTATRNEKKDTQVPAATTVITQQQIKESGAKNAAEILSKVQGFAYKSLGPADSAMGRMTNELSIRGNNNVLVLLNGNPIAWRGKYNIDAIPAESIARIEIVRGSGSVLYGSEAMGGTVNIILRKGKSLDQASIGFGNHGRQHYNLNVGDEGFSVNYSLDKWNRFDGAANAAVTASSRNKLAGETQTNVKDVQKENIGLSWKINDFWDVLYNHYETRTTYERIFDRSDNAYASAGDLYNSHRYKTEQHMTQFNFHDKGWKASGYFNTSLMDGWGYDRSYGKRLTTTDYKQREKNTTYGFDVQKEWKLAKADAVFGMNYQREQFENLTDYLKYARNNWGIFGQWEQKLNARDTAIVSARETWTSGAYKNENYNNFSMAGQFLHKLNKDSSLYVSIGQSFIMPTFAEMYKSSDNSIPNPDLKPQTGINYEVGWKKVTGGHNWKAALFHMDVKDNISAKWSGSSYRYTNEDFRNTGLELSCDIAGKGGFSYQWSALWQNPESKSTSKGYWDRDFGRVQLTGGVTYKKAKWTSSLTGSYLFDRVQTPSGEHSYDAKPYFLTTWNTIYAPDQWNEFELTIDNVLDRKDNTMHTGASYYTAPTSYLLSYTHRF